MNKNERIAALKASAARRPKMSEKSKSILDSIKESSEELFEGDEGFVLPPEEIESEAQIQVEDEENDHNLTEISPMMRGVSKS